MGGEKHMYSLRLIAKGQGHSDILCNQFITLLIYPFAQCTDLENSQLHRSITISRDRKCNNGVKNGINLLSSLSICLSAYLFIYLSILLSKISRSIR